MNRIPGFLRLSLIILFFSILFPLPLYSETMSSDIERTERLGEEFQGQMPWSKDIPKSGAYDGMPQPEDYLSPQGQALPGDDVSKIRNYEYCYNPVTYRYEYCYPSYDNLNYYDYYKYRLYLPGFYLYRGQWRKCPAGYHFSPERGCFRN